MKGQWPSEGNFSRGIDRDAKNEPKLARIWLNSKAKVKERHLVYYKQITWPTQTTMEQKNRWKWEVRE